MQIFGLQDVFEVMLTCLNVAISSKQKCFLKLERKYLEKIEKSEIPVTQNVTIGKLGIEKK